MRIKIIVAILILITAGIFALTAEKSRRANLPAEQSMQIFSDYKETPAIFIPFLPPDKTKSAPLSVIKNKSGIGILPLLDISAESPQTPEQIRDLPQSKPPETYYLKLIGIWSNGFLPEEFSALKKDSDGRPFLVEELAQKLIAGADLNDLKPSLLAWQTLDERTVAELKAFSEYQSASYHQALINWYQYRLQFIQELRSGNLPPEKIENLLNQYRQNSENELSRSALSANNFSL